MENFIKLKHSNEKMPLKLTFKKIKNEYCSKMNLRISYTLIVEEKMCVKYKNKSIKKFQKLFLGPRYCDADHFDATHLKSYNFFGSK